MDEARTAAVMAVADDLVEAFQDFKRDVVAKPDSVGALLTASLKLAGAYAKAAHDLRPPDRPIPSYHDPLHGRCEIVIPRYRG